MERSRRAGNDRVGFANVRDQVDPVRATLHTAALMLIRHPSQASEILLTATLMAASCVPSSMPLLDASSHADAVDHGVLRDASDGSGEHDAIDVAADTTPMIDVADVATSDAGTDALMPADERDTVDAVSDVAIADITSADVAIDSALRDAPVETGTDTGSDVPVATCALGRVVIGEIRSRGPGGAGDEFVDLYNGTSASVTFDSSWTVTIRSSAASTYTVRWTGSGTVVPPYGHLLLAGSGYTQLPVADAVLTPAMTDAGNVVLTHGSGIADSVCYYFDSTTMAALDGTFNCEGAPVSNLPHNNGSSAASNSDHSISRRPGGSAGNCTDTDDNASDFLSTAPSTPMNTASAPTP